MPRQAVYLKCGNRGGAVRRPFFRCGYQPEYRGLHPLGQTRKPGTVLAECLQRAAIPPLYFSASLDRRAEARRRVWLGRGGRK
jgi:hypothetical protein